MSPTVDVIPKSSRGERFDLTNPRQRTYFKQWIRVRYTCK